MFSSGKLHFLLTGQLQLNVVLDTPFLWKIIFKFIGVVGWYLIKLPDSNSLSLQIAAVRDVSATETALIYGLEPLWGAGFAWFLLGERWGTAGWIGAALVLGKYFVLPL